MTSEQVRYILNLLKFEKVGYRTKYDSSKKVTLIFIYNQVKNLLGWVSMILHPTTVNTFTLEMGQIFDPPT